MENEQQETIFDRDVRAIMSALVGLGTNAVYTGDWCVLLGCAEEIAREMERQRNKRKGIE